MQDSYLEHFGIKGQKWGIRRYQNEDGSLTPAGKERYNTNDAGKNMRNFQRDLNRIDRDIVKQKYIQSINSKKANELRKQSKDDTKYKKRASEAQKAVRYGQKHTEALIKNAERMGYSVSKYDGTRDIGTGKTRLINGLVTLGIRATDMALYGSDVSVAMLSPGVVADVYNTINPITRKGTKYKVSNQ